MEQTGKFDVGDYLKTKVDVIEYLSAAVQEAAEMDDDGQSSAFIAAALGEAAKAERKMTAIAQRADVGRESLYKSLGTDANPSFHTVLSAIRALGGQVSIIAA